MPHAICMDALHIGCGCVIIFKRHKKGGESMAIHLSDHYRQKYGCKVYKLSIDAGFTCPNRDGTLGTGGCIFCGADGGSAFAARAGSIADQLQEAKKKVAFKGGEKFVAYFQSFTNTYAPVEHLEACYRQAIIGEDIVGLAIGTRPDCLSDETVALLSKINKSKPVSVELGLQTIHQKSIDYIRRGYENAVYLDAVRRLHEAKIEVVTHIILGLPGETEEMMVETTRAAVAAGTDGVKFHLLHILKDTDLAGDYEAGKFRCLELAEYAAILDRCLAVLPAETVVHRITGDGAKKDLLAPLWSADKKRVLQYLNTHLKNW